MYGTKGKLALILLSGCITGALASGRPHAQQVLKPASEAVFRSDSYEYEYKSGLLRQQELWAVVGLRMRGQLGGPQQYQVWKIDSQGRMVSKIDLGSVSPLNRPQTVEPRIHNLVRLKNNSLAVLVETERQSALLVINGASGQVVETRAVPAISPGMFISKVFMDSEGSIIALGRSGSRGMLLKLQATGELAAQAVIDDQDLAVLTDGLEMQDHTFMLLGERLDDSGKTTTWIGRTTPKGEVLSKRTFSGQGGAISCNPVGLDCAVVYAEPGNNAWNVTVRDFTGSLDSPWQVAVISGIRISPRFRVVKKDDGSIFVAGGNPAHRLWMASLTNTGKISSSSTFEEAAVKWQRLWNFDLLWTQQEFVIPLTELLVGDELEQRQIVKVLRIPQP